MEEKNNLPSDEQIIQRICREFSLTEEETESVRQIVKNLEQTKNDAPKERIKTCTKMMLELTAKFPAKRRELIGHVVRLIWLLLVETRLQQLEEAQKNRR